MTLRTTFLQLLLNSLSSLPFRFLYLLSGFLVFLMKSIIGYRKNVVFQNIRNSFPEKNEMEIKQIAGKFYRNLADLMLNTYSNKPNNSQLPRCRWKINKEEKAF